MYYEDSGSYTTETRMQLINEHIHSLNEYCRRGLKNVDVACQIWDRLITEKDTQKRLSILADGESFLRASIAVAREYSGQIPAPNKLKAFVGDDDLADILIGLLNQISMVIFHFTDRMEKMVEQCATLRRHLEQEALDKKVGRRIGKQHHRPFPSRLSPVEQPGGKVAACNFAKGCCGCPLPSSCAVRIALDQ